MLTSNFSDKFGSYTVFISREFEIRCDIADVRSNDFPNESESY